ncbi:hypothetical protein K2X05_04225 [bacterium]|nr:hypothetical protein [bacterium]
MIVFFCFFHITVFMTFNVGIFITVPMATWMALLPGSFWNTRIGFRLQKIFSSLFDFLQNKVNAPSSPSFTHWRRFNFGLSGALFLVIVWNISNLPGRPIVFPESLKPVIYGGSLQQAFGMFSITLNRSGYLWIPGVLDNGDVVEITSRGELLPARDVFPLFNRTNNPNDRWGKLTETVVSDVLSMRMHFGKYLCRKVNETDAENQKLEAFRIYYVFYKMNNEEYEGPFFESLWNHECFDSMNEKWQKKLDCLNKDLKCESENRSLEN